MAAGESAAIGCVTMRHETPTPLTPKQEQAVAALCTNQSVTQAADSIGMNRATLYRWMDQEVFNNAYRAARRKTFGHAIAMTQRYSAQAVNQLAKIMMDEENPASSRVQAATTILRFGREGVELDDLAARVEAIERLQEDDATGRSWHQQV